MDDVKNEPAGKSPEPAMAKSIDPAALEMLAHADDCGIETAFSRADTMKPCPIGEKGACCRICSMGPCRLVGKDAEAEGIKMGMAPEVEGALQSPVTALGREIRASLDFFEHQQDRPVTEVYLSGGSTRSELISRMLHAEILAECKTWNPTSFLQLALPGQQAVEIEHVGPQLTVAIGTALATY